MRGTEIRIFDRDGSLLFEDGEVDGHIVRDDWVVVWRGGFTHYFNKGDVGEVLVNEWEEESIDGDKDGEDEETGCDARL